MFYIRIQQSKNIYKVVGKTMYLIRNENPNLSVDSMLYNVKKINDHEILTEEEYENLIISEL